MAMSDRMMAKLARERTEMKAEIKKLEARVAKRDAAIIRELERRGTRAVEVAGVRVTKTQTETTTYDWDAIIEEIPSAMRRRVMKRVVDKDAFALAVQAGKIDIAMVDRHSEVGLNKPYITISGVKE